MSGMKFRRTCSICNATFFSPDRKAPYCLKCVKKKIVKHVPSAPKPVDTPPPVRAIQRPSPQLARPAVAVRKQKAPREPRVEELTPELRARIIEIYQEEFANQEVALRDANSQISNKLW